MQTDKRERSRRRIAIAAALALWIAAMIVSAIPVAAGSTTERVTGTNTLDAVACSGATTCVAVGVAASDLSAYLTGSPAHGVVVPITNGVPGGVQVASGTQTLDGVACSSAAKCEAVGFISVGQSSEGVIVPITDGVPGNFVAVPGTVDLNDVACPSSSNCEAVGAATSGPGGAVVTITNGIPNSPQIGPDEASLIAIACMSAAACVAVGYLPTYSVPNAGTAEEGVVVPIKGGEPGSAEEVSTSGALSGVACSGPATCDAVGVNPSGSEPGNPEGSAGMVVPLTNGEPDEPQAVSESTDLSGVACSSSTTCLAEGQNASLGEALVLPLTNGTPGLTQAIPGVTAPFYGVACSSATTCEVVGYHSNHGVYQGVLVLVGSGMVNTSPSAGPSASPSAPPSHGGSGGSRNDSGGGVPGGLIALLAALAVALVAGGGIWLARRQARDEGTRGGRAEGSGRAT